MSSQSIIASARVRRRDRSGRDHIEGGKPRTPVRRVDKEAAGDQRRHERLPQRIDQPIVGHLGARQPCAIEMSGEFRQLFAVIDRGKHDRGLVDHRRGQRKRVPRAVSQRVSATCAKNPANSLRARRAPPTAHATGR